MTFICLHMLRCGIYVGSANIRMNTMHSAALSGLGRNHVSSKSGHSLTRRVKAFFVARREQRQVFDQLNMSTDRELADMGLSRFDISQIATVSGRQAAEKYLAG
ncbi:hypothetical protein RM190_15945 [Paracoccus sp. CPCC 101403]|uniref:DUF1127 domain-containing protein n=1 Tax=Paracoccus broussonetiae TaxID=3075834 RepID=A0ABU3EHV3_9RHOB|nr:hypothetical protein [Paracoccus sp. CPCC 101403]MDT1063367.1 hypothetical protein [Paracoccus sp. CPCC 101403]